MDRKRSKWCFASGCVGRDLCYTLVSLFLLTYIQFTNLVNDAQFLVLSVIIVLCRVWDAVNDPMMGTIISNTRTKYGKYRPWVLIGCIVNVLFFIGLFTIRVDVGNNINSLGWWNVAIIGFFYLGWGMSYTMNDVSYWSLLPVLSESKKERDKLTSMVAIFASVGQFAAGGLVPLLTPGKMVEAYRLIAIIFAVIFLVCQIMVFFFTHDNKDDTFTIQNLDELPKEKSITLKDMFRILFRNKQLLVMALVVLLYTTASSFLTAFGQNFFYFKFGYDGNLMFIFTVIFAVGTLVSQFFFTPLANKFKRIQIVSVSLLVTIIGYIGFLIVANLPIDNSLCYGILCVLGVIIFGGQGFFYMTMLIMLANTIEYDEWKNNERNDAVTFSVRPFMVKLSGAIQYLIVAVSLVVCGLYDISSKIGEVEASISKKEISEEAGVLLIEGLLKQVEGGQLLGLTLAMTVVPIILYVICYYVIKKKYIISEEMYEKMTKEIKERGVSNETN